MLALADMGDCIPAMLRSEDPVEVAAYIAIARRVFDIRKRAK